MSNIPYLYQLDRNASVTANDLTAMAMAVAKASIPVPAPVAPYKVFTALLTQSGGDDYLSQSSGDLTIGVTYQIIEGGSSSGIDFTNVGAPNNNFDTYFVATGTTPNSYGGAILGYNTGAPVTTVLENTIGNVWFTYDGVGAYSLNIQNQFDTVKTYYQFSKTTSAVFIGANFEDIGNYKLDIYSRDSSNEGIDSILFNTPIEIRVYN